MGRLRLERVYVYADPSSPTLNARAVGERVKKVLGVPTTVRRSFFEHHRSRQTESLPARIAASRVANPARPPEPWEPPLAIVLFEERHLASDRRVPGILYDGFQLQAAMRALVPPSERRLSRIHVAFTSRLLGTFDDADRRYHARAIVLGVPNVISTSGLVEGPAKPREFYAAKRGMRIQSADARYESLKETYAGRFLDYDDERLTAVASGHALMAGFHALTGEPFCADRDCVLYNAHWQEDMLHAQVETGQLCPRHRQVAASHRATGGSGTRR